MKKFYFLLVFLFSVIFTQSQIVLEKTYSYKSVSIAKLNSYGWVYYCHNDFSASNNVDIFSSSHNLIKSIPLLIPSNCKYFGVQNVSDNLFNNDQLIEVLIDYCTNDNEFNIVLQNENGQILYEFPDYEMAFIYSIENDYKMMLLHSDLLKRTVYDLPGSMLDLPEISKDLNSLGAYPNPCTSFIFIPHPAEAQMLTIYSIDGKECGNFTLNSSGVIKVDTRTYKPGTYLYKLSKNNIEIQSNTFVVTQ